MTPKQTTANIIKTPSSILPSFDTPLLSIFFSNLSKLVQLHVGLALAKAKTAMSIFTSNATFCYTLDENRLHRSVLAHNGIEVCSKLMQIGSRVLNLMSVIRSGPFWGHVVDCANTLKTTSYRANRIYGQVACHITF